MLTKLDLPCRVRKKGLDLDADAGLEPNTGSPTMLDSPAGARNRLDRYY